ncbi:MAG: MFS transporter [Isosphaeraceae bacterium]
MHFDSNPITAAATENDNQPWYRLLNRYHWFVFIVASLGWLFDTMDQQLFNLARKPAIMYLIGATSPADPGVSRYAGYATTVFMLGWAIGGFAFGILGDRIGRARTMLLTILLYSIFTGLSALSTGVWDFCFYRFLTGLGVGGEFAVGVALVAEVMPDRARPMALGWLQALSAVGNMMAAVLSLALGKLEETGAIGSAWRAMFVLGILPALLSLFIFKKLKEPEKWQKAHDQRKADRAAGIIGKEHALGSIGELFRDPRWRRNTIVGMLLAFSGVVGLWGIGVFTPDLTRTVFDPHFQQVGREQGLEGEALKAFVGGKLTQWASLTLLLFNAGAFFGIYAFSKITSVVGRKPAFAISFVIAMLATLYTFYTLREFHEIFWKLPLLGFCQLALFGGYAIYFPELFPTRLRSTGTSFCYNVGRLVAAAGPSTLGLLASDFYKDYGKTDPSMPFRYAAMTMCAVFLIGLIALPFAPETKGAPLPE